MKKLLATVILLSLLTAPVLALPRERITKKFYAEIQRSFFDSCEATAPEEMTVYKVSIMCDCGSKMYIRNIKAVVKKKKLKFVDQLDAALELTSVSPDSTQQGICWREVENAADL